MSALTEDLPQGSLRGRSDARLKLFWLVQVLRVLSVSYAAWSLYRMVSWWTDEQSVVKNMGRYLGRDLSALASGQRMAALLLDLALWLLLAAAVACCWKMLGYLQRDSAFSAQGARWLAWGGWLGAACQLLSVLTRPLHSYLLTAHLAAAEQVFKWSFFPADLLGTMLCVVIIAFAYLMSWAVEIAEENKGFV
jgi:hypothetical protein